MHAFVLAIIGKIFEVRKRRIGRIERRGARQYIADIDPKKREALAEESKRLMEQLLQRRSQDELN